MPQVGVDQDMMDRCISQVDTKDGGVNSYAVCMSAYKIHHEQDSEGKWKRKEGHKYSNGKWHYQESVEESEEEEIETIIECLGTQGIKESINEIYENCFEETVIDEASSTIKNICLLSENSLNGRKYSRKSLEEFVNLSEGSLALYDHPTKSELKESPNRSVKAVFGKYKNIKLKESKPLKVFGDLEVLETEKPFIFGIAKLKPAKVGNSPRMEGSVVKSKDKGIDIVESLSRVRANELVIDPATTLNLFESINSQKGENKDMTKEEITLEFLTKEKPELIEEIKKGVTMSDEKVKELETKIALLTEETKRKDIVSKLLSASKLKKEHITEVFLKDLNKVSGDKMEEEIKEKILDREKLVLMNQSKPKSYEKEIDLGGVKELSEEEIKKASEKMISEYAN